MKIACLSSAYLAPVSYYAKLYYYDRIEIETWCSYMKQTYRNRCNVLATHGVMSLTIPVEKSATDKILTRDVRISNHGNWRHLHWSTLFSAYHSTPFFEYYADDFRPFYEKPYTYLIDFNQELCDLICQLIGIAPQLSYTTDYRQQFGSDESDYRELIHPKKWMSGADSEFLATPYYQIFGDKFGFVPDLSIVDLLFNLGPESILILKNSHR